MASTTTTCRDVTPDGTLRPGGAGLAGAGLVAVRSWITVARGAGRVVVGLVVGLVTLDDTEGDGAVVASEAGRAVGVALD